MQIWEEMLGSGEEVKEIEMEKKMGTYEKTTTCNTLNLLEYDSPDSEMVSDNGGTK